MVTFYIILFMLNIFVKMDVYKNVKIIVVVFSTWCACLLCYDSDNSRRIAVFAGVG